MVVVKKKQLNKENKEVLKENAKNERNLSEEEKVVKINYGGNRYRIMTEDEKSKIKE